MRLYINAQFLVWLEGKNPRTDRFVYVDQIQYTQQ